MKHKHSEVLHAFVDGIECETWYGDKWVKTTDLMDFDQFEKVRINPEPQKEQEPQYLYVYNHMDEGKTCMSPSLIHVTSEWEYMGKVRVEK